MIDICEDRDISQWTGGCDWEMGIPDYAIFTPANISIPATAAETPEGLISYLRQQSLPNVPADKRFYPIFGQITRITDESTEPEMGSMDKGYTKQLLPPREILLLEWPSSVYSDRHIQKLSRYKGGCLIWNTEKRLVGSENEDGSMGALPVEVTSAFGGGFAGSGGEVQSYRLRIDLGSQDLLNATAKVFPLPPKARFENIIPPAVPVV